MALTAQTTFDITGVTQTITFFENNSQVDQITYSSGQITFQTISQYNLSKSDYLLWYQYLLGFYNLLFVNFSGISFLGAWPLCTFEIQETNVGTKKIIYTQISQGTNALVINYVPIAVSAAFSARGSPVTVSLPEFGTCMVMLAQFTGQVTQN